MPEPLRTPRPHPKGLPPVLDDQGRHVTDEDGNPLYHVSGVVGIVNFAPLTLAVPEDVSLVGVDLATELEQISFSVANREKSC